MTHEKQVLLLMCALRMNTTPVRTDVETPDNVLSLADITVMEDNKTYLTNAESVKANFAEIFG